MRIILIGNYILDKQESMERFAKMLKQGFQHVGLKVEVWRPKPFLGIIATSTNHGVGKWLGYMDKWLIFPVALFLRFQYREIRGRPAFYHICDHSNAPYISFLPKSRTGITCHDVLAIRGALGFKDAYCDASFMGMILQKLILGNLAKAKRLAAVSQRTLQQLEELLDNIHADQTKWRVVYNAFNASFHRLEREEIERLLCMAGVNSSVPFILHVGSGLPRKNCKLLLDMVASLGDNWHGNIIYAGQQSEGDILFNVHSFNLQKRVFFIQNPDHLTLVALYSSCQAFIFPSFSEGFGWPIIEAQACGAPVIASSIEPMPEVSGGAALHADPHKPEEFLAAFTSLQCKDTRYKIIQNGFSNVRRFETSKMIQSYLEMYDLAKLNLK